MRLAILASVVLLAIACSPSAPPPAATVIETRTASGPPDAGPTDDIPLPPPSASSTPLPASPTVDAACAEPCKGATTTDLETVLAFRAKQARRCYQTALATDKTLQGKVMLHVRVGADGNVCSASGDAQGPMMPVAACVAASFRATSFPPPERGCVDVNLPIAFVSAP